MQKPKLIFKYQCPDRLLLERLKELEEISRFDYIRYSDFYTKVCRNFSINKSYAREFLFYLKKSELILLEKRGFTLNY